jgi:signal transduction histidine kinase
VQRLKSITRKLMLLSLADSGQLRPRLEPVNLSEVMEAATEDIQILAPHLRLEQDIESDLWIPADSDLIRQVVQNLTSNCIKYNSPDGLVAITLARTADRIRLTVGNSGPGIPREDCERVFERFYRADKAHNRRVDGTGLGLSLAREIVRAHGGELLLTEAHEGWTVFTATFPAIDKEKPCL